MDIQRIKFPSIADIYRNDPKLKEVDAQELEEWLKTQPHLPQMPQFQQILFLHSCYYELPAAKTTIENYFTFKTDSCLFKDVDIELVRKVLAIYVVAFLPKKTPDGDVVLLLKLMDPSLEHFSYLDNAKVALAIITLYFLQHGPADGVIMVTDMERTTLGHLFKMNISVAKQVAYFVQEAAPLRLKSANHINTLPITKRFVAAIKPFIKKKTYDLLKFHSSLDTFYEVVPKECLPQEYGGLLPSIQELQEQNLKNVIEHWNILRWHDTQRVDESKRIRKEKKPSESMQKIFT